MTDGPTTPPGAPKNPPAKRRGIVNADVPSETLKTGLPDVGQGASAVHFARDAVPYQAGEGEKQGVDTTVDPDNPKV